MAKNVTRTLDNTRIYDSTSYLTANPETLRAAAERAAEASRRTNGDEEPSQPLNEGAKLGDDGSHEDEDMPEAGPSTLPLTAEPVTSTVEPVADGGEEATGEAGEDAAEQLDVPPPAPPRILVTTSPSPSKEMYQFCGDLRNVFPGGQFFKRPKGKGFELGRVARWAAKRGYGAVIVVNEDHKMPSAYPGCHEGVADTT